MTEIDHWEVKKRIKEILSAKTAILSVGAREGKVGKIQIGVPQGGTITPQSTNFIFVTNAVPFETIRPRGTKSDTDAAYPILEHDVNYEIVVILTANKSEVVEERLDDIQHEILEALEAKPQLHDSAGANPLCDNSHPSRVDLYQNHEWKGKQRQARSITLTCTFTTP